MKGNKQMKTTTQPQIPESPASPVSRASARDGYSAGLRASVSRASGEKPFHANFITQFETVLEFPLLHVTVNARGQATYMGRTTAFTDDQLVNLIDGSGTATYTLTAASRMANDGSGLRRYACPGSRRSGWGHDHTEGGVIFSGSYTITGGTGRFNGATGSGVFGGSGLFLTETDGIGAFAVAGTISSPGSLK